MEFGILLKMQTVGDLPILYYLLPVLSCTKIGCDICYLSQIEFLHVRIPQFLQVVCMMFIMKLCTLFFQQFSEE